MDSDGVIMHEALPFPYFYHVSDCSVQCAIETRNGEMTVLVMCCHMCRYWWYFSRMLHLSSWLLPV